jgi:type IV secretion system protein VirB11
MSCERSLQGTEATMSSQREPPTLNVAPLAGTSDVSALRLTLRALEPLLANPDVTEICINRPQEAFVETGSGWRRESLPFATFDWCRRLAKLVANSTRQRIDESTPLLSA